MVAAKPVVNLYQEPSRTVQVTSQVLYGFAVEVQERREAWWRVCTADGYGAWAEAEDFAAWEPLPGSVVAQVSQLSANLYREPDVKTGAPVLNVPWEARLEAIATTGGDTSGTDSNGLLTAGHWLRVRLLDGTLAYVQQGDIVFDAEPCSLPAMLALAHRFLGITYTWGGTSAYGYDCSGYVQMLFRQAGYTLPRDAREQVQWQGFEPAEPEALQPADVVFFGDTPDAITHVGLYLGDEQFIHDTTEGHPCIQTSALADLPWRERFRAARRLRP